MREATTREELSADAEDEARRLLMAAFETAPVRPGLAADLASAAGQDGAASPVGAVVAEVRRRATWQRRVRVLVPAGAVAVAAAVAGGVTVGVVTGAGTTASPDGRAVLTAALAKTSAQSFRFNATAITRSTEINGGIYTARPWSRTGEFDPVSGNGEEVLHAMGWGDRPARFIGKFEYLEGDWLRGGVHKRWLKVLKPAPLSASELLYQQAVGGPNADQPDDPAGLLALLRSAGQVTRQGPVSGNGWTGTKYGFAESAGELGSVVSGTVSVDSSGRVRELTISAVSKVKGTTRTYINDESVDVTFGDFGIPVTVAAPPASQVYDAGNTRVNFYGPGY